MVGRPDAASAATLSVGTFGAVGDGVTDDTAAIQSAANAAAAEGKQLVFGPGTYLVSAPIQASTGVVWTAAPGTATLVAAGDQPVIEAVLANDVTISGLILSGRAQAGGPPAALLIAYRSSGLTLSDDSVQNTTGIGLLLSDVSNTTISGSTFTNVGNAANLDHAAQAVAFTTDLAGYGSNNTVSGSNFHNIGLDSISMTGQANAVVVGNTVLNDLIPSGWSSLPAANAGLYIQGSQGVTVSSNAILTVGGNGIDLADVQGLMVSDNAVTGSGAAGIALTNVTNATVRGNLITNSDQLHHFIYTAGITLAGASTTNINVSGNLSGSTNGSPETQAIQNLANTPSINIDPTNIGAAALTASTVAIGGALATSGPAIQLSHTTALTGDDLHAIMPFVGTVFSVANLSETYNVTVQLSDSTAGTFSDPAVQASGSTLTLSGSATVLNALLNQVTFIPRPGRVAPGQTNILSIDLSVSDNHGDIEASQTAVTIRAAATLSVGTFGAVGDGVTDDTAAIQSAANAAAAEGKQLVFGPGTYLVSAPIQASTGVVWTAAPGTATLVAAGDQPVIEAVLANDVTISGLILSGRAQAGGPPAALLIAYRSSGLTLSDDSVQNTTGIGLLLSDVSNTTISGSTFTNVGNAANLDHAAQAVAFTTDLAGYGSNNTVSGSNFHNIGFTAVSATGQTGFLAFQNSIANDAIQPGWGAMAYAGSAIYLRDGSGTITGNTISTAADNGIDAVNVQGLMVSDNAVTGSGAAGIALTNVTNATVRGNLITNSDQLHHFIYTAGITLAGASTTNINVSGNLSGSTNGSPETQAIQNLANTPSINIDPTNIGAAVLTASTVAIGGALATSGPAIQLSHTTALTGDDLHAIMPFVGTVFSVANLSETYNVTVQLSDSTAGTFSDPAVQASGSTLTLSGSATVLNALLNQVTFIPRPGRVAPGQTNILSIDLSVSDNHGDIEASQTAVTIRAAATLSVGTFGAVGDGVTDDTAAIQSAANAAAAEGKQLVFGPGTYLVSAPIQASTGVVWTAAPGTATLVAAGDQPVIEAVLANDVTISGLILSGRAQAGGPPAALLIAYRSSGLTLSDDSVQNTTGIGLLLSDVSNTTISGSTFTNVGNAANLDHAAQAVAFTTDLAGYGSNNTVSGSNFHNIGFTAVSATGQTGFLAFQNSIANDAIQPGWGAMAYAGSAIYLRDGSGTITGNTISTAADNGIDAVNVQGLMVSDNAVTGSGAAGIALTNVTNATVRGNLITNSDQLHHFIYTAGITLAGASTTNINVSGNLSGSTNGSPETQAIQNLANTPSINIDLQDLDNGPMTFLNTVFSLPTLSSPVQPLMFSDIPSAGAIWQVGAQMKGTGQRLLAASTLGGKTELALLGAGIAPEALIKGQDAAGSLILGLRF